MKTNLKDYPPENSSSLTAAQQRVVLRVRSLSPQLEEIVSVSVPTLENSPPGHVEQLMGSHPGLEEFVGKHPWEEIKNIDTESLTQALKDPDLRSSTLQYGRPPFTRIRLDPYPGQIQNPDELKPGMEILIVCRLDNNVEKTDSITITDYPYQDKGNNWLVRCRGTINGASRETLDLGSLGITVKVLPNGEKVWGGNWNYAMYP